MTVTSVLLASAKSSAGRADEGRTDCRCESLVALGSSRSRAKASIAPGIRRLTAIDGHTGPARLPDEDGDGHVSGTFLLRKLRRPVCVEYGALAGGAVAAEVGDDEIDLEPGHAPSLGERIEDALTP